MSPLGVAPGVLYALDLFVLVVFLLTFDLPDFPDYFDPPDRLLFVSFSFFALGVLLRVVDLFDLADLFDFADLLLFYDLTSSSFPPSYCKSSSSISYSPVYIHSSADPPSLRELFLILLPSENPSLSFSSSTAFPSGSPLGVATSYLLCLAINLDGLGSTSGTL